MSELLDLALHLADLADSITSDGFSSRDFDVSRKGDATEVTTIDRAAETALREVVTARRPSDGFYGEEHGRVNPDSRLQWVVDPIDGTSNFVRGVPVWATLIALVDDDSPVIGVISAPALGRRWWGEKGSGAFANGRQIRVSDVTSLEDAHVSITHSRGWNLPNRTMLPRLVRSTMPLPAARLKPAYGSTLVPCVIAAGSSAWHWMQPVAHWPSIRAILRR